MKYFGKSSAILSRKAAMHRNVVPVPVKKMNRFSDKGMGRFIEMDPATREAGSSGSGRCV